MAEKQYFCGENQQNLKMYEEMSLSMVIVCSIAYGCFSTKPQRQVLCYTYGGYKCDRIERRNGRYV